MCTAVDASDLADDPLFATAADRLANRAALRDRLRDEFARRDLDHWRERLDATGCVYAVLATVPEVLDDPQVRANGYLAQHPEHGHVRLAANPIQFDGQALAVERGAPAVGQHTAEVLTEVGFGPDEIAALRAAGALGR